MTRDLICFCHLRWNFVYQRPQHLLSRFSKISRVFLFEEPIFDSEADYLEISKDSRYNVWIITPHLPQGLTAEEICKKEQNFLSEVMKKKEIHDYTLWYYSPMALRFSEHLSPVLTVYDCMDELSGFRFAPTELTVLEGRLLQKADIVFTGGYSLFQAKKEKHQFIYPFPSSIDKDHFSMARSWTNEMEDQSDIPHPRLGYYGVIDERINLQLVEEVAAMRPNWQFIFIGPVVKIDPNTLPIKNNIHYLGGRDYNELPKYLASWDIAIMPFALNESTKFISPTKTPEYLAGGKPVISTSITDVVNPYAKQGMVQIADSAEEFVAAADRILSSPFSEEWLSKVDFYLADISWDKTWQNMLGLINERIKKPKSIKTKKENTHV